MRCALCNRLGFIKWEGLLLCALHAHDLGVEQKSARAFREMEERA
jgi:hypothetical protein